MKKIKNIIKNNIVGFIIGVIIAITISAYAAATTLQSSAVYYDNSKSGGSSNTVSGAIDELYEKAKTTEFKVGDYVKMTPTKTSYRIGGTLLGSRTYILNPSELNLWRVIRINSDKTVDMVSEYVSSIAIEFYNTTGYANYVGALNIIAKQYENPKYTVGSRHVGYNGQTEFIDGWAELTTVGNKVQTLSETLGGGDSGYENDLVLIWRAVGTYDALIVNTNTTGGYFVSSRTRTWYNTAQVNYAIFILDPSNNRYWKTIWWCNSTSCDAHPERVLKYYRPIVTLKSGIKASSGNGTSATPYILN